MIHLRDVHKRFGSQVVLDGVDFDVQEGETVALLGPSGTGKSVLLKHIIGLIRPDSGTIIVDDEEVGRAQAQGARRAPLPDRLRLPERRAVRLDERVRERPARHHRRREVPGPGVRPAAGRRVPQAGQPRARGDAEVPGGALGRHAEAGGDRARHRRQPEVPALRRAHLGPRPGQRRRDRQPGETARQRAGRDQRHGDPRRARRLPHRQPARAPHRRQDRAAGHPGGVPASNNPKVRSSSSGTSPTPLSPPETDHGSELQAGKSPSAAS